MSDFYTAFDLFMKGIIELNKTYMAKTYPNNPLDEFSATFGKKYAKVIRSGSVHCFVNMENGDILKAAGWAKPAKHARGNIHNEDHGMGRMGPYGPEYLR